jgi:hypothetical protein
MASNTHFFQDAPCISWLDYIRRQLPYATTHPPALLPDSPTMSPDQTKLQRSALGTLPRRMKAEHVKTYIQFLRTHFFPEDHAYSLQLPEQLFASMLKSGQWIGAEIRDTRNTLIGIVVSKYMGEEPTLRKSMGMIDYLCVHPQWRKKGITNSLLRAVYAFCAPQRKIQLFQKEGLPASIPPLSITCYYTRNKRKYTQPIYVKRVQEPPSNNIIYQTMKEYASLLCRPQSQQTISEIEIYETLPTQSNQTISGLLLYPTHEINKSTQQASAVIVGWYSYSPSPSTLSYDLEAILDSLAHYNHYFAPSYFPRHEWLGWSASGYISTHAFHYDPGIPVSQHLVSLVSF